MTQYENLSLFFSMITIILVFGIFFSNRKYQAKLLSQQLEYLHKSEDKNLLINIMGKHREQRIAEEQKPNPNIHLIKLLKEQENNCSKSIEYFQSQQHKIKTGLDNLHK